MDVIMVHGFWDTGRLFRAMAAHLEAEGHTCHTPTLEPRDGRLGIPYLSGKLAAYGKAHVEAGAPVAFVGFSMGAVVARHHLQGPERPGSVSAFFSIAGPHGGTPTAYFYPGLATREMRPGSRFLREMHAGADALRGIPVFTYRTPFDLMVVPPSSTRLPSATERVFRTLFHSMLPGDPRVIGAIAAELGSLKPG
jgi:triacylglycerol lipase